MKFDSNKFQYFQKPMNTLIRFIYKQQINLTMDETSFNFTLNSKFMHHNNDAIDRIHTDLHLLEEENSLLEKELHNIKNNPWEYVKDAERMLFHKIDELKAENQGLENLIEKQKTPGFAEMTKKKTCANETPGKKSYMKDHQNVRNVEEYSDVQSSKGAPSTCQNYDFNNVPEDPIISLQPLQNHQLRSRAHLTYQLLQTIDNTAQIQKQLQQAEQLKQQNNSIGRYNSKIESTNKQKLKKISQYKKKLLQLLHKLKKKQVSIQQIVEQYKKMYEKTSEQLIQATSILSNLQEAHVTENIDDLYAEVLNLEQRLGYINQQLERLDESQWMRDVLQEFHFVLRKLGIEFSIEGISEDKVRQKIDEACQVLIQCIGTKKVNERDRINLLKFYYQQQKENNKKILKNLQKQEQNLSKKLIDLQMNQQ